MNVEVWMLIVTAAVPILTVAGAAIVLSNSWGRMQERMSRLEKDVSEKASKESHDGLREMLATFKSDMDRRFDHLERIVRGDTSPGD